MASTDAPFFTTGSWQPFPGQADAFVGAWQEFARWAATFPGAGEAILVHDLRVDDRYVSFLGWEGMDEIRAWKGHPEFKERMGRVQQFVDGFSPTETEVVARVRGAA